MTSTSWCRAINWTGRGRAHAGGLASDGSVAYDQRYYRRWMHEIPPLQTCQRATVIDVHHAILPDTARYHPDSAKLRSRAVAVEGLPGVYVLASEDRILHSATHLFHDGELPHGLRDLTDLDLLLREAAASPASGHALSARADELQLSRSSFLCPAVSGRSLDTPVPDSAMASLDTVAPNRVARSR